MTPTKYDIIKELLSSLPLATFNVQDWCIELLRLDYRAISVPFEIYWRVVSHPSCSNVYEKQSTLYPFLNSFVLCGLEIKCGDDWEFWKLVKETT